MEDKKNDILNTYLDVINDRFIGKNTNDIADKELLKLYEKIVSSINHSREIITLDIDNKSKYNHLFLLSIAIKNEIDSYVKKYCMKNHLKFKYYNNNDYIIDGNIILLSNIFEMYNKLEEIKSKKNNANKNKSKVLDIFTKYPKN